MYYDPSSTVTSPRTPAAVASSPSSPSMRNWRSNTRSPSSSPWPHLP